MLILAFFFSITPMLLLGLSFNFFSTDTMVMLLQVAYSGSLIAQRSPTFLNLWAAQWDFHTAHSCNTTHLPQRSSSWVKDKCVPRAFYSIPGADVLHDYGKMVAWWFHSQVGIRHQHPLQCNPRSGYMGYGWGCATDRGRRQGIRRILFLDFYAAIKKRLCFSFSRASTPTSCMHPPTECVPCFYYSCSLR